MASFDYDTLPVNPAEKGKPYRQPLKGQLALAGFKNLTPFNEKAKEVDSATTKGKQSRKGKGEDAENDEDSDIEMGEDGSVAPEDEDGHQEHFPARASSAIAAKTKRKRTEDATTTASKRLQTAPAHLRAGTEPLQQLRQPQAAPKSLMVALKCGDRLRDTLARVGRSSTMAPALCCHSGLPFLESARCFLAECSTTFTFTPLPLCAYVYLMYITLCIYSVGQSTQFSYAVVDVLSTAIVMSPDTCYCTLLQ
ncbi:hypothetical protein TUN205_11569 [Pyrenophora tritici-repentis]|nr:hypothetical protein TUN205_11569 [Pyrenophora tritici-repentis]